MDEYVPVCNISEREGEGEGERERGSFSLPSSSG